MIHDFVNHGTLRAAYCNSLDISTYNSINNELCSFRLPIIMGETKLREIYRGNFGCINLSAIHVTLTTWCDVNQHHELSCSNISSLYQPHKSFSSSFERGKTSQTQTLSWEPAYDGFESKGSFLQLTVESGMKGSSNGIKGDDTFNFDKLANRGSSF